MGGALRVEIGCRLIAVTGWALITAGAVALLLAATITLLPHDVAYLGMTIEELCRFHDCRVARFMTHDRTAFGGSLIALGVVYRWLARQALRAGQRWSWWTLFASGVAGFASFLTYLGHGYLDLWHGRATLALLPLFFGGLTLSYGRWAKGVEDGDLPRTRRFGMGRLLLVGTAAGMMAAGATITTVGMTQVFVPQDLEYMGARPAQLAAINERLVPLIAHDRAGFGGGLFAAGLAILGVSWFGLRPADRALWRALALAGAAGFGCAIGVHFLIGYTSLSHLAPAYLGAAMFVAAIARLHGPMAGGSV